MRGMLAVAALAAFLGGLGWALTRPAETGAEGGSAPPVSVILAPVQVAEFSDALEALGTTRARESVRLTATITEKVTQIGFGDGAFVDQGAVLVRLDDASERAELAAAKARSEEKRRKLERVRRLVRQESLSDADLDSARAELETASAEVEVLKADLADRVVTAPFAGRVGLRQISVGSLITPGDLITTLDDIAVLNIDFTVPATELASLRVGLPVHIRSGAYADGSFAGKLVAIGTQVDPVTRAVTARAVLPNPDQKLRPGMLVELEILAAQRQGLAVPEAAVISRNQQRFVFIDQGGQAARREVSTGARRDGLVEIRHGLETGELVVVHGADKLSDGRPLNPIAIYDGSTPVAELIRQGGS